MTTSINSFELLIEKHVKYIQQLDKKRDDLAYYFTEHLRMNGIYWGLTALSLMNKVDSLPREEMIEWVMSCWNEEVGAFSPHPKHDTHLHSTLSAIQILATHNAMDRLNVDKLVKYILSLQAPNGCFAGDEWGELDSRFSYCAISALSLLGQLNSIDKEVIERTVNFIKSCKNFDGGFGMVEGAESHAAYVWTCLGTLAILNRLDIVDTESLSWWLCERQLPNGGLNGRPEKLEDVCYSWWAIASLAILGRTHWVDGQKLSNFILSAQDPEEGGIADRPEDMADVFHTVFGLAGLSLLNYPGLIEVDPIYCMSKEVTRRVLGK